MDIEYQVLMIDDEPEVLEAQKMTLRTAGIGNVITLDDGREVLPLLREKEVGVVLLDLTLPHISGEELLRRITDEFPSLPVIVVTATDDIDTAVSCIKNGAVDYMVKAVERTRLIKGVENALEIRNWRLRFDHLKQRLLDDTLERPEAFSSIVTQNRRMRALFQYIETIAKTSLPVFISGETGTGKELLAEAVHSAARMEGQFVPVNIAGLDDSMFSDTLFGHKKGAYTGADTSRKGLVEEAAGGTLFIDEIGELQASSQVKLLRLLERGDYYSLGSDIRKRSAARIVLATQRSPEELLQSEGFRRDLYYRVSAHTVELPPLRERKDDIPLLLHFFVEEACRQVGTEPPSIPRQLYTLLDAYHFPGNVRELRSMVWDAVSRQRGGVLSMAPFREVIKRSVGTVAEEKPEDMLSFGPQLPTIRTATDMLIAEALNRSKGNISVAANLLGISRQALSKRLNNRGE
jgi:DNA-binding NtrC family response regulator